MKNGCGKYFLMLAIFAVTLATALTSCKEGEVSEDSFYPHTESIVAESVFSYDESVENASSQADSTGSSSENSIKETSIEDEDSSISTSETSTSEEGGSVDTPQPEPEPELPVSSEEVEDLEPENPDDFGEGNDISIHVHTIVEESKEPNCTETGYYKTWCSGCDAESLKTFEVIPALGHKEATISGFDPNCYMEGKTEETYCYVCGEVLIPSEIIPTVDHAYSIGFGSCIWCDVHSELKYEIRERDNLGGGREFYAVCLGMDRDEYTPFTILRFLDIPDTITFKDVNEYNDEVTYVCPVTEIADYAFCEWYDINTVTLGKNIEKIGYRAFAYCYNLREIYNKSSVTLKEYEVEKNGAITQFVKAKDIHCEADYTPSVRVDESSGCILYTDGKVVEMIGIRDTTYDLVIPEGVTKINCYVFYKAFTVTRVTIATTVNYIEMNAFAYVCEFHEDKDHDVYACRASIKEIVMLNPKGWCAYEFEYAEKFIEFEPGALTTEFHELWDKLMMEYVTYRWIRKEEPSKATN